MAHLRLGTASFITSPERDKLATLRGRYMEIGLRHQSQFHSCFSGFKTADNLFQRFPGELEAALSETASMVATDIAANRVYDLDIRTIQTELKERLETVRDGFDSVQDRYFEVLGKAAELDAQRKEAMENRGHIVGGGFGVEGAASGIAMAAVANAAISLTYGLANLTAKGASALGDGKKKRELLTDPDTKMVLGKFLCSAVLQGYELVASTVNDSTGAIVFDVVPNEARQKSVAMVENVATGRVPDNDVQAVLVRALELDPFSERVWTTWIDRFGDADGSVGASGDALGVGAVEEHKARLLSQQKAGLAWSTPEECEANLAQLEQFAVWLGFPFESERAEIEQLAINLDLARRTVEGVAYPTKAEAETALAEISTREISDCEALSAVDFKQFVHRETKKLWTPGDNWMVFGSIIVGALLFSTGAIGLLPIAFGLWRSQVLNKRYRLVLERDRPELFLRN